MAYRIYQLKRHHLLPAHPQARMFFFSKEVKEGALDAVPAG